MMRHQPQLQPLPLLLLLLPIAAAFTPSDLCVTGGGGISAAPSLWVDARWRRRPVLAAGDDGGGKRGYKFGDLTKSLIGGRVEKVRWSLHRFSLFHAREGASSNNFKHCSLLVITSWHFLIQADIWRLSTFLFRSLDNRREPSPTRISLISAQL